MLAPRLLVSPDLVPRAVLAGLAPARSARPSVPSRPQRPLQSGLTDGITQRYICRIALLEASASPYPVARQDGDGATFVNLRNDVTLGPCAGAGSRANLRAQTS